MNKKLFNWINFYQSEVFVDKSMKALIKEIKDTNDPLERNSLAQQLQKICKMPKDFLEFEVYGGIDILKSFFHSKEPLQKRRAAAIIANVASGKVKYPNFLEETSEIIRQDGLIEEIFKILQKLEDKTNDLSVVKNTSTALMNIAIESR